MLRRSNGSAAGLLMLWGLVGCGEGERPLSAVASSARGSTDCEDQDEDGVCDDVDTCPAIANPSQHEAFGPLRTLLGLPEDLDVAAWAWLDVDRNGHDDLVACFEEPGQPIGWASATPRGFGEIKWLDLIDPLLLCEDLDSDDVDGDSRDELLVTVSTGADVQRGAFQLRVVARGTDGAWSTVERLPSNEAVAHVQLARFVDGDPADVLYWRQSPVGDWELVRQSLLPGPMDPDVPVVLRTTSSDRVGEPIVVNYNDDAWLDIVWAEDEVIWLVTGGRSLSTPRMLYNAGAFAASLVASMDHNGPDAQDLLFWAENDGIHLLRIDRTVLPVPEDRESLIVADDEPRVYHELAIGVVDPGWPDLVVARGGNGFPTFDSRYRTPDIRWHQLHATGFPLDETLLAGGEATLPGVAYIDGEPSVLYVAEGQLTLVSEDTETLGPPVNPDIDTRTRARHVAVGRLDQDLDPDIVVAYGNQLVWFAGSPTGQLAAQPLLSDQVSFDVPGLVNFPLEPDPNPVVVADLDGDSDGDVLTAFANRPSWDLPFPEPIPNPPVSVRLLWFRNQGSLGFDPEEKVLGDLPQLLVRPAAHDLNGDDFLDVVVGTSNGPLWYPFDPQEVAFDDAISVSPDTPYGGSVVGVDLDDDGDVDLLGTDLGPDGVHWFDNQRPATPPVDPTTISFAQRILPVDAFALEVRSVADLNGDGLGDLLALVTPLEDDSARVQWFENLGAGSFAAPRDLVRETYDDVQAADLDDDGFADLVIRPAGWRRNLQDGQFGPTQFLTGPDDEIQIADVTGDGALDLMLLPDDELPRVSVLANALPLPLDTDEDGLCDESDPCPVYPFERDVDSDNDTVPDDCDICEGHDDAVDTDDDTVPDGCDVCPGSNDLVDTDQDTFPDGCDPCPGFDDRIDDDGDGIGDDCDECPGGDDTLDLDGNGVSDDCESFVPRPWFCGTATPSGSLLLVLGGVLALRRRTRSPVSLLVDADQVRPVRIPTTPTKPIREPIRR